MKIVKGILSILCGIVAGSIVNASIILLAFAVLRAPDGINLFDAESFKANADKFTAANFVGTWLAHLLGTLVGAFVAAKIAPVRKMIFAIAVGVWFLFGGLYAATLVQAPIWYLVADLALYIPVAIFARKLAGQTKAAVPVTA
jgi:hypothetical protein